MSWIGATVYKIRSRVKQSAAKRQFKRNIEKYTPIIVYQMGKVGSTSIYNSLKSAYKGEVLHKHTLHKKEDWKSAMVLEYVLAHKIPLKLISLVREPVGRNVSAFFQNLELVTGIAPSGLKYTPEELKNVFLSSPVMDHGVPLTWFDNNMKADFGIDVFAQPFPQGEGWKIIKKDNIELLLMKAELSDSTKESLVSDFAGIKNFTLISSNIGDDKDYAELYKTFRKNVRLPENYLNLLYNSEHVKHFYSDKEIEMARKNWQA